MRRALVLLAVFPAVAVAQWHEPLAVRNHRSADLVFLRLAPRSHIAPPGGSVSSLSLVEANEFQLTGPIDEDAETFRPVWSLGWGLVNGTEAFVEVPLLVRGGGFMDPIIEWWHGHVIRTGDPARETAPTGRSHIEFPGGGPYGSASGLGDVTVGVARSLRPGLLGRVAAKVPTGNPSSLTGSGAFDFGGAADWRVPLGDAWALDLNAGLVFQGTPSELAGARSSVFSYAVGVTWEQSSRDAWTVQLNAEQSPTVTGEPRLDRDHRVLSFGYQRLLRDGSILQLYFSENGDFMKFPGGPTVGPDLTIGARLVRRM